MDAHKQQGRSLSHTAIQIRQIIYLDAVSVQNSVRSAQRVKMTLLWFK